MQERKAYEWFIDQFVDRAKGNVIADRIRSRGHSERLNDEDLPLSAEERERKNFLLSMNNRQRDVLIEMLCEHRRAAFHDALNLLDGLIASEDLTISAKGSCIDECGDGTFNYDFICRFEGDDWLDSSG